MAGVNRTTLGFSVESLSGGVPQVVTVPVSAAYNFGYAARDQDALKAHLEESASKGSPGPETIPAIFPVVPDRVCMDSHIFVSGDASYAEVEYALINTGTSGWIVTVAADHSDDAVERHDVPRAKNITPDVLATQAWWLSEVVDVMDQMELCGARIDGDQAEILQRDLLSSLLAPDVLLETLRRRLGAEPVPGCVILSGTINGTLSPGGRAWRISLADPANGRTISHSYTVSQLPSELPEPR